MTNILIDSQCQQWIPLLSVKNIDAIVPELIWWKVSPLVFPCHSTVLVDWSIPGLVRYSTLKNVMEIQRFLENKIPTSLTITTTTSSLVKATAPFKEYRDLRRRFDPKFPFLLQKTLPHFKLSFFDILSLFYPHGPPICFPFLWQVVCTFKS